MSKAFDQIMSGFEDVERYMEGNREGFAIHIPDDVDVRAIRKGLNLSQPKFAKSFGLSVGRVRDWEQKRSPIDAPARAFFTVLRHEPEAVFRAMGASRAGSKAVASRRSKRAPSSRARAAKAG
jgi:putative transcriptional regulator